MSLFNKLFGGDEPKDQSTPTSFWNKIESEEDLTKVTEKSFENKVVIFKHSTRCHISKMVLKNFEKEVANSDKEVTYYLLDLIAHRPISNKIAADYDVIHQSPQLIVLEHGIAVKDASHQSISVNLI
jgi:bacillithiol system protein YtxJ